MTFIRHEAKVVVGPRNIDITVELTFYEYPSLAERRRMDRDHDEVISEAELSSHLAGLREMLRDAVSLSVDGRALPVVPLYDPQIDLLGAAGVVPSHHVLRLFFFARTPEWLRAGSRLCIEDKLWPDAPRIDALDAVGRDGFGIVAEEGQGPRPMPEAATGPRGISLVCQVVPAARVEAPRLAGSAQVDMHEQQELSAGVVTFLVLVIAAGVAGGVRRYVSHRMRGGPS